MKGYRLIALLLALILMLGGCSKKTSSDYAQDNKTVSKVSKETSVDELIASMTLEEKVGQMIQGARDMMPANDVKRLKLGSILSGGGSYPKNNTVKDWQEMIGKYHTYF